MNLKNKQQGQSLVEVVIALALFSLVAAALLNFVMGGGQALTQGGEQTKAAALAQEGMEAIRSIRDYAWNELIYSQSGVGTSSNRWVFDGEGTSDTIGEFTRTATFTNVCRNALYQIVDCPGTYTDVESKKVTVTVSWPVRPGVTDSVQRISYLTDWKSTDWTQTDWSGGSGQSTWSVANKFNSSDGNIDFTGTSGLIDLAAKTGGPATTTWDFGTSTDYTYDSRYIKIYGSFANLASTTVGAVSSTTNPDFTSNSTGWTFAVWETGTTPCTGTRVTSGGNPTAYINISTPSSKNTTRSGYWYQAFTATSTTITSAIVSFDWKITAYSGAGLTSYYVYVFVDKTSGAPTLGTQVWSSSAITGTTNWATVANIDVSSIVTGPGTYYLKVATRRISASNSSGTNTAGFDNVHANWTGNTVTYPTNSPTTTPITAFVPTAITSWTNFLETANTNGGSITYQLSSDNGTNWKYWSGSAWATTTVTTATNTASVINTNINKFATTTKSIKFRAFLNSNGSQFVQLDRVDIGYGGGGSSGYQTSGYLISSAYNLIDNSPVQAITWDETIPTCSPTCSVQLQVSTAPDVSGSPGTWSSWYGASGAGTYFTNHYGTLISKDLNWNRWVRYRAQLTGDGINTPVLSEVRINYK